MPRFHQPDLTTNIDSPFVRDGDNKLIRRSYWLDMDERTLVMIMTKGIGANLTNDEKRAHLADIKREHLIDQVCPQEILPPQNSSNSESKGCPPNSREPGAKDCISRSRRAAPVPSP
jgi:hypothetical protein